MVSVQRCWNVCTGWLSLVTVENANSDLELRIWLPHTHRHTTCASQRLSVGTCCAPLSWAWTAELSPEKWPNIETKRDTSNHRGQWFQLNAAEMFEKWLLSTFACGVPAHLTQTSKLEGKQPMKYAHRHCVAVRSETPTTTKPRRWLKNQSGNKAVVEESMRQEGGGWRIKEATRRWGRIRNKNAHVQSLVVSYKILTRVWDYRSNKHQGGGEESYGTCCSFLGWCGATLQGPVTWKPRCSKRFCLVLCCQQRRWFCFFAAKDQTEAVVEESRRQQGGGEESQTKNKT